MKRVADEPWGPDALGPGFECTTLPLGVDSEGEMVATLVRFLGERGPGPWDNVDVLYVHGWSDYFFQAELAREVAGWGARFFALDLRKYGRSLRPWQTPGYIEDLSTYDDEVGQALRRMRTREAGRRLVLVGHSTGGLVLSLWAHRHPGQAAALVLNSPWLEFQMAGAGRAALTPLVDVGARVDPRGTMPNVDFGFYSRATSARLEGEWVYDEAWRPERAFPARAGWLRAILAGHARVAAGLSLRIPVLTLLSTKSTLATRWSEAMRETDTVLVVDEIAERATRLGRSVTIVRLDGALHDVFLSAPAVRNEAYEAVERWSRGAL